ncbi:hypothetical protein FOQG_14840 [Fusarium oxysporum f. sp. raphani 54005]|uniref:Uncharacterized protein n=2 Tax=Fusarium oxysporum f. sp. raphani TaxID=96318 RepID=X0BQ80_FUSOX|nr:hypothetical protein FOQG_14840 [Fusarium oxysporum f. sp. raphani 54005]KAG7437414.1 hypothetical protein Forpi1262_v001964 [Fusarium oxysporum f. sp. raphani]
MLTGTVPGVIIETPTRPPALSCDEGGYLIQVRTLYRLNLVTGQNVQVGNNIGPRGIFNAAGFNIFDNLIYPMIQIAGVKSLVIRIGAGGSYTLISTTLNRSAFSVHQRPINVSE